MSAPPRPPSIPSGLMRQELPWLAAEALLLVVLFHANPPELWFWLVVLLVILGYRIERWWASRSP
ncbi:MAG: hypothetical protein RLZZ609_525 [Cyanobacteriota bacterium]